MPTYAKISTKVIFITATFSFGFNRKVFVGTDKNYAKSESQEHTSAHFGTQWKISNQSTIDLPANPHLKYMLIEFEKHELALKMGGFVLRELEE